MDEQVKRQTAERPACYTGLPADYWMHNNLKIDSARDFMTRVLPGWTLDLYDARMKTSAGMPYNEIGSTNSPLRVMNGLLLPRLGVTGVRDMSAFGRSLRDAILKGNIKGPRIMVGGKGQKNVM